MSNGNSGSNSTSLRTSIGDASAWRADLRAGGVERRSPPSTKTEPDRKHVDRDSPALPRRSIITVADKPPQVTTAPAPAPAPAAPKLAPATPEDKSRAFYNPEFRAEIVADFYASRRVEAHLTQKQYADRVGIDQTTLSAWLADANADQRRQETAAKRQRTREAAAAARAARKESARSFEAVSLDLAEAIAEAKRCNERVQQLKDELRALLDEGE